MDDNNYLSLYKEYTVFHKWYKEKIVVEEIISHDFDVTDEYFATPNQLRIMKLNKLKQCLKSEIK